MKLIPVGNKFAMVDDEDFGRLSRFTWHIQVSESGNGYAATNIPTKTTDGNRQKGVKMHRMIVGYELCDHRDRNSLNNQKHNLRPATHAQNSWNSGVRVNNKSGFKGVMFVKDRQKWKAKITANGKRFDLGRFKTKEEAAAAYNFAALKLHGEFAYQNQIAKTNPAL